MCEHEVGYVGDSVAGGLDPREECFVPALSGHARVDQHWFGAADEVSGDVAGRPVDRELDPVDVVKRIRGTGRIRRAGRVRHERSPALTRSLVSDTSRVPSMWPSEVPAVR